MPWFKVDDGLADHPKTVLAGNAAMGLWVRAGSWSAKHLTGGLIPGHMVPILGNRAQAAALVKAGLWVAENSNFRFHQWDEDGRQPTRESVLAERAAARERQQRAREKARSSRRDTDVSHAVVTPAVTVPPTRPDPTRPIDSSTKSQNAAKRGSRVPSNFTITDTMRDWARENVPLVNIDSVMPEWVDYWKGVAGEKGVKLDWEATWHNGMRKQQQWAARDRPVDAPSPRRVVSGRAAG